MNRRPPRSTRTDTLFPYKTLFRSALDVIDMAIQLHGGGGMSDDFPLANAWVGARSLRLADGPDAVHRSEEHTSELQSLMRISYAVFCLRKKLVNDAGLTNSDRTKKAKQNIRTTLTNP